MPGIVRRVAQSPEKFESPKSKSPPSATVSKAPDSASQDAVISLSPTPISPFVAPSTPLIRLTGKPRSLFNVMRRPSSPTPGTPASMPSLSPWTNAGSDVGEEAGDDAGKDPELKPTKRMKLATVE